MVTSLHWNPQLFLISLGIKAEGQYIFWLPVYICDIFYYFPSGLFCISCTKLLFFSLNTGISLSQDICTFSPLQNIIALYLCYLLAHLFSKSFSGDFIYFLTIAYLFISISLSLWKLLPSNTYFAYCVCCLFFLLLLEYSSMVEITLFTSPWGLG